MTIPPRDTMGGLAKGLAVIETFSADHPRQSIAQVATATGLDRATARRCLLTLAHLGYADYDGKYFTLTPRVLRLGTACLATMPLPNLVQPWLDKLSEALGESSSVSILDGDEIVYLARASQHKIMSIALMPGTRLPAFCTSMGRVLLAALPDPEVARRLHAKLLTARTPLTLTDPAAILDGGALLPFGGHKGAGIAFMVEVLAAALSGGRFGFNDESPKFPGAQTSRAGQFLLLIDPARGPGGDVAGRISGLVAMLREAGAQRMPGDERHHRRALAVTQGITIPDEAHARLVAMGQA